MLGTNGQKTRAFQMPTVLSNIHSESHQVIKGYRREVEGWGIRGKKSDHGQPSYTYFLKDMKKIAT